MVSNRTVCSTIFLFYEAPYRWHTADKIDIILYVMCKRKHEIMSTICLVPHNLFAEHMLSPL